MEKIFKSLVILLILGFLGTPGCAGWFSPVATQASDEDQIKAAVQAYFSLRYQALQANLPLVLDAVVDQTDPKTSEWLKLEADRREVEMFIHSEYEMQILAYKFDLNYTRIEIIQNRASVHLFEGNEITYANNPDYPAALAGLEHELSLLKANDQWLISNDDYSDEIVRLLRISTKEKLLETVKFNADHNK